MKQTIVLFLATTAASIGLVFGTTVVLPAVSGTFSQVAFAVCGPEDDFAGCCQGDDTNVGCDDPEVTDCQQAQNCNLYVKYINPIIVFLSAVVGLAVTIGLILGGIKYASAGGEPGKVAEAKKQIYVAVFALVAFGLLWAFLNWILPGGING